MDAEKMAKRCPNCGAEMRDASISECVPGERWECRHCLLEGPDVALELIRAAYDAQAKRVAELEAERDALRAKVEELEGAKEAYYRMGERVVQLEDAIGLKNELFAASGRKTAVQERDELRAALERVRDVLSDCSLDHSIDAVSAIEAVLPKREG